MLTIEKGLLYFLSHRYYWPLFRARLIPICFLSALILTILSVFAFLPQVALLAVFHGAAAWQSAFVLTLGEGAAIVGLLYEAFFVDECQVDVFDAVLIDQGLSDLVAQARLLDQTTENSVQMLGKPTVSSTYAPFSLRQIIEFIILLPLNLIPYVGVPIFLILTGYRAGPFHHWRYFKLLGLTKKERTQYIKRRQLKYTWFGIVSLILQLVPVLQMFFLLTTAVGSGLWAAKMEKARRLREEAPASAEHEPYQDAP